MSRYTHKQLIARAQLIAPYLKDPALHEEFSTQENFPFVEALFGDVMFGHGVSARVRRDRGALMTIYKCARKGGA